MRAGGFSYARSLFSSRSHCPHADYRVSVQCESGGVAIFFLALALFLALCFNIQELLVHESSKTTERYAQVTKRGFEQLISPLHYLFSSNALEKK